MIKYILAVAVMLFSSLTFGDAVTIEAKNGENLRWVYDGPHCNRLGIERLGTHDYRIVSRYGMVGDNGLKYLSKSYHKHAAVQALINILVEANPIYSDLSKHDTYENFVSSLEGKATLLPSREEEKEMSPTTQLKYVDVLIPSQCFQFSKIVEDGSDYKIKFVNESVTHQVTQVPYADTEDYAEVLQP